MHGMRLQMKRQKKNNNKRQLLKKPLLTSFSQMQKLPYKKEIQLKNLS
jgi:hypothetical protein